MLSTFSRQSAPGVLPGCPLANPGDGPFSALTPGAQAQRRGFSGWVDAGRALALALPLLSVGWVSTASAATPDAPTDLAATPGNGSVDLTWTAPFDGGSPITDYVIEYKLSSDFVWLNFADGTSIATSVTVTGLNNGSSYDFRVSAVNGDGTGSPSAPATALLACVVDADCGAAEWCDTGAAPAACVADLSNGTAMPNVPSHADPVLDGTCTVSAASVVCISGVCDTADNQCGYANGTGPCNPTNAATVCRSGACSDNGACRPAGGCNVDSDCSASQWCNTGTNTCQAKANTGSPIPAGGLCSAGLSARCKSGTCDPDNLCGHANGLGPCTNGNAAGNSGQCRSSVCDPMAGGGTGLCRECTAMNATNCSGVNVCNTGTFSCTPCNGDNGTVALATCPSTTAPYCPGGGAACTTCGTVGGTTTCQAGGALHAGAICQANGACASSCVNDTNCQATQWCNSGTCAAKAATGVAIPGGGACSGGVSTRCLSGVCSSDDICGRPNGQGPCTIANASGTSGRCRSGVCDPNANGGLGLCRQCTAADLTNCSGAAPICDSNSFACSACNGDNGTTATAVCGNAAPYCPGGGAACTTCGQAGETFRCLDSAAVHAGGVCQGNGACSSACVRDSNCLTTQWCKTDATPQAVCTADLENGAAMPNVGGHTAPDLNGTCTAAAAAVVCASGVCDARDNACGYGIGGAPCTLDNGALVCRSGVCSPYAECRPAAGCSDDSNCLPSQTCDGRSGLCKDKPVTEPGTPVIDPSVDTGFIGGSGCRANGAGGLPGGLLLFGFAGLALQLARRRRRSILRR